LCLNVSQAEEIPPFFLGYAYEALARAESTAGNRKQAQEYIDQAKSIAEKIQEADDKKQLLNDLNTIT
jgi:hypothetical protein